MMRIRKFTENLQNEKELSKKERSIQLAKECIEKCKECKQACENHNHEESAKSCDECIQSCELYIFSAENESRNYYKIGKLSSDIAKDCADICEKQGMGICVESCLEFSKEIETLLN